MNISKKVSVIIPCYNEERFIRNTINSILSQDYPAELMEIMVADGQSTDNTAGILRKLSSDHSNVKIFDNPDKTVPFAFNLCIPQASGDVIVIIGAHSEIPAHYISTLVKYLFELDASNVGGLLETLPPDDSDKSIAIAMACSSRIGMGDSHFRVGSNKIREVDTVPFGCYKKEIFEKVGMFDTELTRNQDDEFNARVLKGGGKIFLIPEIKLKYFARNAFDKLWTMFYQYGLFKPLVSKKMGRPTTFRQLVPPLFILSIIILILLSIFHVGFLFLLLLEFILYEGLILISGWRIQMKPKSISVLMQFLVSIYVIHFAYGIGYLNGIVKFVLFGNKSSNQSFKSSR